MENNAQILTFYVVIYKIIKEQNFKNKGEIMDTNELANKLRSNPNNESLYIEDVIKWCDENAEKLNLSNQDETFLCEKATKYLMKNKEQRKWNKEDAKFVTSFLANKAIKKLNHDEYVKITFLEKDEYTRIYGDNSRGICVPKMDDSFDIAYSPDVIEDLTSNNKNKFLNGLQTIYHEIRHVSQSKSICNEKGENGQELPKNKERYLTALETVARLKSIENRNDKFYKENYHRLLKENDANKYGLIIALKTMQEYAPNLYKQYAMADVLKMAQQYDKNYYDASITIANTNENYDFKKQVDTEASIYIEKHPEIIGKYPILQVGFHKDGSKKDIIELIEDRNSMLENGATLENVNELYEIIANHRNPLAGKLNGTKAEMEALTNYVKRTGTDDEFVLGLIEYKLEHKFKYTPEERKTFMNKLVKQKKPEEQEEPSKKINHEKEKSTKDEIGDESSNKHKTKAEKQEEEKATIMWQQRFQVWDRNSINLPNEANRKNGAVKAIQNIEKEKQTQVKREEQNKNEEAQKEEQIKNKQR